MSDERRKFTLYLHPEKNADKQALEVIESVPRSARGELFRNAFISGMALQQLDPRLPELLAVLLSHDFSADQLIGLVSQTTGWKPSQADIRAVLTELGAGQLSPVPIPPTEDKNELDAVREKMSKLF